VVGAWTEFIWLRIGMGVELLGFHKMWEISCLAKNQLASQERLCFMERERESKGRECIFIVFC